MKERFVPRNFSAESLAIVEKAGHIALEYARQGYDLTLRQLYYQFVSRNIIANKDSEYKRLGSILNDARLAGMIDWDHLEDRTRNLMSVMHFDDPQDRINRAARNYAIDLWEGQEYRVEVWVEKEALAGVVDRAASSLDCAYFSCRGYVSQSEMYAAAKRLRGYVDAGQKPIILHLGDHDPSGIDMTRDIRERLNMMICDGQDFEMLVDTVKEVWGDSDPWRVEDDELNDLWYENAISSDGRPSVEVKRIALNMPQIRQYNPPPNPAKLTDARCTRYIKQYGSYSWELDALDPATLNALIRQQILAHMDEDAYNARHAQQEKERENLTACAGKWADVCEMLEASQ